MFFGRICVFEVPRCTCLSKVLFVGVEMMGLTVRMINLRQYAVLELLFEIPAGTPRRSLPVPDGDGDNLVLPVPVLAGTGSEVSTPRPRGDKKSVPVPILLSPVNTLL